jgi:hypothetical protein
VSVCACFVQICICTSFRQTAISSIYHSLLCLFSLSYVCACLCPCRCSCVCAHRCMYRRYHQSFYVWKNQFCSVTAHTTPRNTTLRPDNDVACAPHLTVAHTLFLQCNTGVFLSVSLSLNLSVCPTVCLRRCSCLPIYLSRCLACFVIPFSFSLHTLLPSLTHAHTSSNI